MNCLCGCGLEVREGNRFIRFHSNKGKFNPNYGKDVSKETRMKISLANTGKVRSFETRLKYSKLTKERYKNSDFRKKISEIRKQWIGEKNPFFGKHHSEKSRKKISNRPYLTGPNHYWFKPERIYNDYPREWTEALKESIRKRDNYKCQLCEISQEECSRKLHIHHRDGDKSNLNSKNLISLCCSCHSWLERKATALGDKSMQNLEIAGNSFKDNLQPSRKEGSETIMGSSLKDGGIVRSIEQFIEVGRNDQPLTKVRVTRMLRPQRILRGVLK